MPAAVGVSQQLGAGRQVERLAMPMKYSFRTCESAAQRVPRRGFRPVNRIPADRFHGIRVHAGPQRFGDQLRSEADSKNRLPQRDGLADQIELLPDVGQIVIGGHRTAHEDKPISSANVGLSTVAEVEIGVLAPYSLRGERIGDEPEIFNREVAEGEDFERMPDVRFWMFAGFRMASGIDYGIEINQHPKSNISLLKLLESGSACRRSATSLETALRPASADDRPASAAPLHASC